MHNRIRKQTNIVNFSSLILLTVLILLFFVRARSIVQSIDEMVDDTKKITRDVSYRIPEESSALSEFNVLRDALNSMAENTSVQIKALVSEIQNRREMEFMLSQGKKEWERTFNAVPDMIFILDLNYCILRANQAMLDFFELSSQEISGRKCCEVVHQTDEAPSFCQLINPDPTASEEAQLCRRHEFYEKRLGYNLSVTMSPLHDGDGVLTGYVHIMRDITEQVNAEKQRRTMERKLQKSEKMEAIGLMAGGVAHDLNNILSGIINYPELMLMQMGENNRWKTSLETIRDSGLRAAAIVSDLLTIARGAVCKKERHNLNPLIEEYLSTAEFRKLSERFPTVQVETELARDLYDCDCSPIHILKLLMNLITNGIEAMEEQGIMSIFTKNEYLSSRRQLDDIYEEEVPGGQYVKIDIGDTGPGIPKKDLARIFEPFYSKKAMGQSGTGLGLAVAWNAVQDHNGFITVKSDSQGSIFTILLPATVEVGKAVTRNNALEHLHGSGTVLVVDDDPLQRDIAEQMLAILGYTATTAANGSDAVRYMADHEVDLLLLDMIMEPDMNGRQTLERILEFRPDQKTLIITGYAECDEVKKACALGTTELLSKPYTMQQLSKKINMILKG